eukprot:TRINITY_DN2319_c0_g2_i3.p1 TRINITY_DN2319_c0_g2~~TRINITY_DN2319_c0_g2_i3.p1  ORF type:complete len:2726 (-),score=1059.52 TRINITY_DN2319_c0_g2_i3:6-7787(-)
MEEPGFEDLEAVDAELTELEASWASYHEFEEEIDQIKAEKWLGYRLVELSDFHTKWFDLMKGKTLGPCIRIKEVAKQIEGAKSALNEAKGEGFESEHWTEAFKKLGMPSGLRHSDLTVGHFFDVLPALKKNTKFLRALSDRARNEVSIKESLNEINAWCECTEFALQELDGNKSVMVIVEWKDLFTELGDKQAILQSMSDSPYFARFAAQAKGHETNFAMLDEYLHNLNTIQRKWVYLEPIFGRGALPSHQKRFESLDMEYREIMSKIVADQKLLNLTDEQLHINLGSRLTSILERLNYCQKALAEYLEEKRTKMPRFYFIGDDDLLEILGQAQNPGVIQAHLKKLFQGVFKVEFSEDNSCITAMYSLAGEKVQLEKQVPVTDAVEEWLVSFSEEMKNTLRQLLVRCLEDKSADLSSYPSQILCLAEQVHFTTRCENALQQNDANTALKALQEQMMGQLDEYTNIGDQMASSDSKDAKLIRLKIKSLILDLTHNADVVTLLMKESTVDPWLWKKQLRYYVISNRNNQCVMKMSDTQFDYTYEYQGNSPKLVHTPLTDKCYLTLTDGMNNGYGGSPYGPAGTGKTESVKALGAAFGRQVLVFNCDEGIDFQSMGRIFTGLVKCGAWGCFDEFNRLKEDQLSAVSQQIQVIQAAIMEKAPTVILMDSTIEVDHNAGIFVTMNPAGKGYGGRSKLPDNLKQLFRPVAMTTPNNELIAEVMLYSEGFKNAKPLSKKIVQLFQSCRDLIPSRQHYDWGLRAIKTCLNTGGGLVQKWKKSGQQVTDSNELLHIEGEIVIKAVRVNTLSKLTPDDTERFLKLIANIFPGVKSESVRDASLEDAIREVMTQKPFCLKYDEDQVSKMLQLKESLDQRMGCVIVGPSGCGKSTLWRILQAALTKLGETIKTHVMNPKSMTRHRLLGEMDLDTREWQDGVLTAAARQVVKEPLTTRSWVVCDGDVDPVWIESLNSVLDDNHLLTLPNGERINFGSNVNFLFETHDLKFASPATISRMGMVALSDQNVSVTRILECWVGQQQNAGDLGIWIDDYFYKALEWVMEKDSWCIPTTLVGTINSGLSQLTNCPSKTHFAVSLIRGLGANMIEKDRREFAKFVFELVGETAPPNTSPLDCYVNSKGRLVQLGTADSDDESGVVQTVSFQKSSEIVNKWLDEAHPFVLVGPDGAGKTTLLEHSFRSRPNVSVSVLHCNAQTTAEHVILKLRQSCVLLSTSQGRVYRPREGEKLVLFLKDINLPRPDQYETCMLIAFLQQLITFKGFYDEQLEFLSLERVQIICAVNPAETVGRHALSPRFTAIVRIAHVGLPSNSELMEIYAKSAQRALSTCSVRQWQSSDKQRKLALTIVELYNSLRSKFSVDDHRHYSFSPRDMSQWLDNLSLYPLDSEEAVLKALIYEAQRLFRDRLVDKQSEITFDGLLTATVRSHLGTVPDIRQIAFTAPEQRPKPGEALKLIPLSRDDVKISIAQAIKNAERQDIDLRMLLFDEIVDQVACVDRALAIPGGALLLVGRSGVGRRNAITLVSHRHEMQIFSPQVNRLYDMRKFNAELKEILRIAGVEGQECVFLLEDHHLVESAMLESINSVLSSGEIPGLCTHEEMEAMLMPLKDTMQSDPLAQDYRSANEYFLARVKKNLHIVLSLDPTAPEFLPNCEANPALYSKCTILWFGEWAHDSMTEISNMILKTVESDIEQLSPKTKLQDLAKNIVEVHESNKCRGATPRDLVHFLDNYINLFRDRKEELSGDIERLEKGFGKLREAAQTVDTLTKEAASKKIQLKEKQAAADNAMEEITKALAIASQRKQEGETLQKNLEAASKGAETRKKDIEEKLADAQPALESAKEAVKGIKNDQINEIKSFTMPPTAIQDVLGAVLQLLGIKDMTWRSMRQFLSNRGVKDDILHFDARRITPQVRSAVTKILKSKKDSFRAENIKRVSLAAAPLAGWVKANIKYSIVLDTIGPLEGQLVEAQRQLKDGQLQMDSNQKELAIIDKNVRKLKEEFQQRTLEATVLQTDLAKTESTLKKANNLLSKLSDEHVRWEKTVKDLRASAESMPKRVLLGASFTMYLSSEAEDIRQECLQSWADLIGFRNFDFLHTFSTESQLLTWKAEGLPSDQLSMENALVASLTKTRSPFIIDPSSSTLKWLNKFLSQNPNSALTVIQQQDSSFMTKVDAAARFGGTLLITEANSIDTMLMPLLKKDLTRGSRKVQMGDKVVDVNKNFRLCLFTRSPNPQLPPSAAALVSVINFTVTRSGLEGQLLGVTLKNEEPELETRKSKLLQEEEDFKVQLAGLEKELLAELAASQGDLLENQALVASLTKTKAKSLEIQEALQRSEEMSLRLDAQRDVYLPFAMKGSAIFFIMQQLKNLNTMYDFSLQAFLGLFKATLTEKMEELPTEQRIAKLGSNLENKVLFFIGRSLFKDDRLTFAMHIIHGLKPDLFRDNEWEFFTGQLVAEISGGQPRDFPSWATAERAQMFALLKEKLPLLFQSLTLNDNDMWNRWSTAVECEKEFPSKLRGITAFQRLLVIQTFRPDRLQTAIQLFCCKSLGVASITPPPPAWDNVASEAGNRTPVLMITTPGKFFFFTENFPSFQ